MMEVQAWIFNSQMIQKNPSELYRLEHTVRQGSTVHNTELSNFTRKVEVYYSQPG
jgi:hypothetical protein